MWKVWPRRNPAFIDGDRDDDERGVGRRGRGGIGRSASIFRGGIRGPEHNWQVPRARASPCHHQCKRGLWTLGLVTRLCQSTASRAAVLGDPSGCVGAPGRSESSRGIGRRNGEAASGAGVNVAAAAEDADKEGAAEAGGGGNGRRVRMERAAEEVGAATTVTVTRKRTTGSSQAETGKRPRSTPTRSKPIELCLALDPIRVFLIAALTRRPPDSFAGEQGVRERRHQAPNDMAEIAAAEGIRPGAMNVPVES